MTESPTPTISAWDAIAHILTGHVSAMGREQMIGPDVVTTLTGAIARVREQAVPGDDVIELVRDFDARLETQVQPDVASAGRTGRSPVDVSAAVARLEALSLLRTLDGWLARCERALILLAEQNYPVLMPVTMDGFVSQPTSVAHWLGAVIEQSGRARDTIRFAYDQTDCSPLGASALASSGFAVDRARLARELGFNAAIESTFDAVASIDWISACANAIDGALMPLQRFSNEIFTWFRIEPDAFRIGDWLMESASGIPQWTGPYGLVRLNADLEHIAFQAHILAHEAASVPYGPQLAVLGRIARGLQTIGAEAAAALAEVTRFLEEGLIVNAGYFSNRAGRNFSTSSDLADFLIIEEHLAPAEAEQIAAITIQRAREQGLEASGITANLIDGAAIMVIGREMKVEFEAISRYLAPRRFIERRTALGAPSPAGMRTWVQHRKQDAIERDAKMDERATRLHSALAATRQAEEHAVRELHETH